MSSCMAGCVAATAALMALMSRVGLGMIDLAGSDTVGHVGFELLAWGLRCLTVRGHVGFDAVDGGLLLCGQR